MDGLWKYKKNGDLRSTGIDFKMISLARSAAANVSFATHILCYTCSHPRVRDREGEILDQSEEREDK